MLLNFFFALKKGGIPVSIKELLTLLDALQQHIAFGSIDDFYLLSRIALVKDERYYDKFDRAFALYFKDLETLDDFLDILIPEDWLRAEFINSLSEEEKAKIESLGGLEKLIEEFKKRLAEQKKRHEGGNKWIGTKGTSPFGNSGYNPEGVRVGGEGGQKKALKVWEKREFKNLDDTIELGTRNIKVALRRLRKFARTGATEELDLDDTIRCTAKNAGLLDIKMVPERHNAVKVLIFFDVGGSMDPYVRTCEELFSATKTEFKHLEYFYFHNALYDYVWKDNFRRYNEKTETIDLLRTYAADYKVIFVGDASMSPYELESPGGSVEYYNKETGIEWLERMVHTYPKMIWLNPVRRDYWEHTPTIQRVRGVIEDRMFPLTLGGLEEGIAQLAK
ncbi:MAG TPA: VWA domain-containing protein [Porticoccaceae bacterium]|nr:VWA domain-containing protein [Porticoccaceae bacterium]